MRDLNELMQIKGMGQAKAATVLAALEIGRRIASARPLDKIHFAVRRMVRHFDATPALCHKGTIFGNFVKQ